MGDYTVTKVVMKVKKEYLPALTSFLETPSLSSQDETLFTEFWEKIGISIEENVSVMFGKGHFHAYKTSLGSSDDRYGSYFYNTKNLPLLQDGFWFVEFGSKCKGQKPFISQVVPQLAEAWLGLYGKEEQDFPTKYSYKEHLMTSYEENTENLLTLFKKEIEEYDLTKEQADSDNWWGYR